MLNGLIRWSLARPLLVVFIAVGLMVWGLVTARQMPLDVFPNFSPPQIIVQTEAPGLAPEEVESLVTLPLESALGGTPGVTAVRSRSAVGLSVVTVIFGWDVEAYRARQLVGEKVQLVAPRLPDGVEPPVLSPLSSTLGDIVMFALTIDPKATTPTSFMDLTTLANTQIRNRLLAVPGVTRVLAIGGEQKQYQVLVKPERLKQYGLTLQQVVEAAEGANFNAPGGFLQTPDREYLIRGVGRVRSLDQLENSVVDAKDGTPIRLGDVATVRFGPALRRGDGSLNGERAVIVMVTRQPAADTPTVTRAVEAAMAELRQTLPPDVRVTTTFRQEDFIDASVENVLAALRDGAIAVTVVLIFFLGSARTMAVTLAALPLSVLVGVLVLNGFGVGLNTMTLGGLAIALGEVIDDAIIDAENVVRRLRENALLEHPRPAITVVYEASVQIRSSVVFATLILCVVVAPIFALTGVEGRIFTPLGLAYIAATLASLLVALTLTPALCLLLLKDHQPRAEETRLVRLLKDTYQPVLRSCLANPRPVLGGAALAFAGSLLLLPGLGRTFLPEFQERNLVIAVAQLPGASLESTQRMGIAVERALLRYPEIQSAQFRAGRTLGDDDADDVNFGHLDVQIAPGVTDRARVLAAVRAEFAKLPGVVPNVGGFISHRIDEVLSGSRAAIAVKIFGPDLDELRRLARAVESAMRPINGVADLQIEPQASVERLEIEFDRNAANRYGLKVKDLARTVETAFNGRVVSQVVEGQRAFDLVVWLDPAARARARTIENLLVDTPSGAIPLSQVAKVGFSEGTNAVNRENVSRRIVVSANATERDLGSVIADVRERIGSRVTFPQGYYVQYGGQFEAQERASSELLLYGGLALAAVALLLYSVVGSVRGALIVLSNLPLAMIGGIVAVWLGGGVLSVASLVGFVTLFGIANRNGIILVTTYNQMLAEGKPFDEVIVRASLERLSPVLMTALTAGLSMVPLAIGLGAGKELLQPLAVVVLGGLFTSTMLTLVVLPVLFSRFGGPARPAGESMPDKRISVAQEQ